MRQFTTITEFKALLWETRFVLTKLQGEILRSAIEQSTADKEVLVTLRMLNAAIHTCNEVDSLSGESTNEKKLASILTTQVNFAAIENLLDEKAQADH
jgi:hypothetical protein